MRERGLKYIHVPEGRYQSGYVAPRAGAWIEIFEVTKDVRLLEVAPRAGAWIEIKMVQTE